MTIPLAALATSSQIFPVISNAKGNTPFPHVKASNRLLDHHSTTKTHGNLSAPFDAWLPWSLRNLCQASFVFRGPLTGYLLCERCNGRDLDVLVKLFLGVKSEWFGKEWLLIIWVKLVVVLKYTSPFGIRAFFGGDILRSHKIILQWLREFQHEKIMSFELNNKDFSKKWNLTHDRTFYKPDIKEAKAQLSNNLHTSSFRQAWPPWQIPSPS